MTFRRLKRSSINDKLKVTEIVIVSFKTVLIKLLDKLCKINFKLQSREEIYLETPKSMADTLICINNLVLAKIIKWI